MSMITAEFSPLASSGTLSLSQRSPVPSKTSNSSTSRRAKRRAAKRGEGESAEVEPEDAPAEQVEAEAAPAYTIDDLAAATSIPSRTIRFYQSSGVLPKPEKIGRIAYYGQQHIERLEMIGKMQDRGLRMRAIKDLVTQVERGDVVLHEWLGLEEQLSSAWVDDGPKLLTRAQLRELIGERRPGFIAELVRAGTLEQHGDDAYLAPSPGLLQVAARLDDAGVSVDVATGAAGILQKHLAKAAKELAGYFADHAGDGFGHGDSVVSISDAFRELRSTGPESVRLIFAREMEQVLRKMVETGETSRIEKKIDKKKRRRKRGAAAGDQ
ncbi:MerR family transcriptional regulator [Enhygromyxa salina]|uniref:Mercuric resistance operon regulatory protein n=1 Tax=Enhygromyxa salina TaxID=215803 RepID=A0A2S9XTX7_9BACT|nr:MerR family transcriptional regulator [Enhygromyxa salina]PRP96329.1 Mercuric resistance operon regulatory protein [Enhygromyxa salina]